MTDARALFKELDIKIEHYKHDLAFIDELLNNYEFNKFDFHKLYFKIDDNYEIGIDIDLMRVYKRNYKQLKLILNNEKKKRLLHLILTKKDLLSVTKPMFLVIEFNEKETDRLLNVLEWLEENTIRIKFQKCFESYYDSINNRIGYNYIFMNTGGNIGFEFCFNNKDILNNQLLWFDIMKKQIQRLQMIEGLK